MSNVAKLMSFPSHLFFSLSSTTSMWGRFSSGTPKDGTPCCTAVVLGIWKAWVAVSKVWLELSSLFLSSSSLPWCPCRLPLALKKRTWYTFYFYTYFIKKVCVKHECPRWYKVPPHPQGICNVSEVWETLKRTYQVCLLYDHQNLITDGQADKRSKY